MATTICLQEADSPTRKRAFADDETNPYAFSPSLKKVEFCLPTVQLVTPTPLTLPQASTNKSGRQRKNSSTDSRSGRRMNALCRTSMQAQSSPQTFAAPLSSFMTVFDQDSARRELEDLVDRHATNTQNPISGSNEALTRSSPPFALFHQHSDSLSTSASESSDSSPTTTVSTLDDSPMTEPSPGPSPESPNSLPSPLTHVMDASRFHPSERPILHSHKTADNAHTPFFDMQQPNLSAKKPRNLKNLAVNTTSAYNLGRAVMSAPFVSAPGHVTERTSEPSSPSFVKPPTPPRRRLTKLGLTIKTPGNCNVTRLPMPSTPSLSRPNILRHFQSSPSLPLCTPGTAPGGGMKLPPARTRPGPRGFANILPEGEEMEEEEEEQNFDVPQSQEEKPDSYPTGPIRIYESGVDLYLEPTAEIASRYDVILNVASEVQNPFLTKGNGEPSKSNPSSPAGSSDASASPCTTPKATPIAAQHPMMPLPRSAASLHQPEYIHIPWEHNTDIVPDLYNLVKLIDERVQQGKQVLIHCQCGVSRSASLIVAYGLYKNPGISVQEAYDAVKKRSKWIGPNMNLIMQLQEFRTKLIPSSSRDDDFRRQLFSLPRKLSTNLSSASTVESFDIGSASSRQTPRTAALPPDGALLQNSPRTSSMQASSAGPVENREGLTWDRELCRSWVSSPQSPSDAAVKGLNEMERVSIRQDTQCVDTTSRVVPVTTLHGQEAPAFPLRNVNHLDEVHNVNLLKRKTPNLSRQLSCRKGYESDAHMAEAPPLIPSLPSPRAEEFHMVGIDKDNSAPNDDSFGILSPTISHFPSNPFHEFSKTAEKLHRFSFSPSASSMMKKKIHDPLSSKSQTSSSVSTIPSLSLRTDSLQPTAGDGLFAAPQRKGLKSKFSSPNLQEVRSLHQMQQHIHASLPQAAILPKRCFDDLDALMSPRATEFTTNPFHERLSASGVSNELLAISPITPTASETDPRSPAIHGISPITRNIFDVL